MTILLHKPWGCVTARRDDRHTTVMDYLPAELQHLHPVGRLDRDTEGLLLLTDNGALTAHLTHPTHQVPKTYAFWALGNLSAEKLCRLENGLLLPPDPVPTRQAQARVTQRNTLDQITDQIPPPYREKLLKNRNLPVVAGSLTITEGRTHQVRRMLRAVDCAVIRLRRVALGSVVLGELPAGDWRRLDEAEEVALWQ